MFLAQCYNPGKFPLSCSLLTVGCSSCTLFPGGHITPSTGYDFIYAFQVLFPSFSRPKIWPFPFLSNYKSQHSGFPVSLFVLGESGLYVHLLPRCQLIAVSFGSWEFSLLSCKLSHFLEVYLLFRTYVYFSKMTYQIFDP